MRKTSKQESSSANFASDSLNSTEAEIRKGVFRTHVEVSDVLAANWPHTRSPQIDSPHSVRVGVQETETQKTETSETLPAPRVASQRAVANATTEFSSLCAAIERQVATSCDSESIMRLLATGYTYTLGITSAVVGEGKTMVAIHLAMQAARNSAYRVCLIDLSLGEDEICQRMGVTSNGTGIVSILEQTTQTFPTLQFDGYENLVVIPAGKAPVNASKTARSPHLAELIRSIGQMFDLIIVDLPAVATEDALPLVEHMDGIVMVTRAGATPRDLIAKSLDFIGRNKVVGVVLNRVQFSGPRWLENLLQNRKR